MPVKEKNPFFFPLRLCARLHRYAKRRGLVTRTGLCEALRAGLGVRSFFFICVLACLIYHSRSALNSPGPEPRGVLS